MIKPGISELSRCVDSRYTLVTMAAKRARMLGSNQEEDVKTKKSIKPVSIAVREIAEGKVSYTRHSKADGELSWQTELIELEDTVPAVMDEAEEEE